MSCAASEDILRISGIDGVIDWELSLMQHDVSSAIELSYGDGHQLSLMTYAKYTGLDVSGAAVIRCMDKFADDPTKGFFVYALPRCHLPYRL